MGVVATIASGGNLLAGIQVYSFVSGAINSAISGDIGAFAIGTAASIALGPLCSGIGESIAGATVGLGKTFLRGALIGAAEFGSAGFISGFATEYARTGSGSDALRAGAWGAAGGAILGAAIEGSYVQGWQTSLHGLDMDKINSIDAARSDLPSLMNSEGGFNLTQNKNGSWSQSWDKNTEFYSNVGYVRYNVAAKTTLTVSYSGNNVYHLSSSNPIKFSMVPKDVPGANLFDNTFSDVKIRCIYGEEFTYVEGNMRGPISLTKGRNIYP